MRHYLLTVLIAVAYQIGYAQNTEKKEVKADTIKDKAKADTLKDKVKDDGEIKLSDSFLKALDGAFSFDPVAAPLPKYNELTVEQLHEWVGPPSETNKKLQSEKFDSTYKALKMWEKEFYVPVPLPEPIDFGLSFKDERPGARVSFDANALGKYIRPKEYRLYKVRKIANRLRPFMDEAYPLEGPAWIEKKKGPAQKEQDLIIEQKDSINNQILPQELRP